MTRRMKIALIALVIAAVLTAGAVVLLSGSGNGYESVFKAGVKSIMDARSLTLNGRAEVFVNGEKEVDAGYVYMKDGKNSYSKDTDYMIEEGVSETYKIGGKKIYNIDHETKQYDQYTLYADSFTWTEGEDENEPGDETIVRLVKLFADFYMGNAKNQFVREHIADGNRYVVTLKREQLPELALLMLELFNEQGDTLYGIRDTYMRIFYQNAPELIRSEYLLRTGKEMDERVFDLRAWNEELSQAYSAFYEEVETKYRKLGEAAYEVGAMFVEADGTYEIYPSTKEMYIDRISKGKELLAYQDPFDYPQNADIKYIHAEFDVSHEGYVTRIFLSGEGSLQDVTGKNYVGEIKVNVEIGNYNQTTIDASAISEYTQRVRDEKTYATVSRTETVEFLGVLYEVDYFEEVEEASDDSDT